MIERKKAEALAYINQFHLLAQVHKLEQPALEHLIEDALSMSEEMAHWPAYEQLKERARGIVGFEARRAELASTSHYQLMMTFLDWLLSEKRRRVHEMARLDDGDKWPIEGEERIEE